MFQFHERDIMSCSNRNTHTLIFSDTGMSPCFSKSHIRQVRPDCGIMDMYDDTKVKVCLTRSRQISGVSLILGLIRLNLASHGHGNWHSEQCLVASRGRPWLHSQIGKLEGSRKSCNWLVDFPAIRPCGTLSHYACQIWTEIYVFPGTCPHAVD
jgi:hypothetical protein